MEKKSIRRFLALFLAVITIVASSMVVFAADTSPGGGNTNPGPVITKKATVVNTNTGKTTVRYSAKNAVKYEIQYKTRAASKWTTKTATSTSYVLNLKLKGLYQIRVRAIGKDGKKSSWTTISYRYVRGTKPTFSTEKTKQIRVKTPKSNGVSGYIIYYSTNKNMTNAKKINVKANYCNKPISVVKGKTYYIRVVPYLKKAGNVYYGDASVKTVKAN